MVYNIKGSNVHPLSFICCKMPNFSLFDGMSDISMEYIGAAYLCYLCLWFIIYYAFLLAIKKQYSYCKSKSTKSNLRTLTDLKACNFKDCNLYRSMCTLGNIKLVTYALSLVNEVFQFAWPHRSALLDLLRRDLPLQCARSKTLERSEHKDNFENITSKFS
jgi:hypothetical protein